MNFYIQKLEILKSGIYREFLQNHLNQIIYFDGKAVNDLFEAIR